MMTAPSPATGWLDPFESQAVFRCLLETLSRPGTVLALPIRGVGAAVVPLALADVETTVAVVGDNAWADRVVRATGAASVPIDGAELVGLCGSADAETLRRLPRGSALAPEVAAKVGIDCRRLHPGRRGEVTLTLTGPGVDGSSILGVDGLDPSVFTALGEVRVDVWLIDRGGQAAGLPRSCHLEVH